MTQTTDQERAEFEAIMRNSQRHNPELLNHLGDSYEFDTMESAWQGFQLGMQAARRAQVVQHGLIEAAQAVVTRWDSALWKDLPATGGYIARLRTALAAAPQPPEANSPEFEGIKTEPVPEFNHAAKRKLELLQENGATITGYAIEKDGRRGAIDCHGFVYWWNEAAPVQMPEPYDYVEWRERGFSKTHKTALYTEHQVRQLLAQHGIK